MKKLHEIPAWFTHDIDEDAANMMPASTIVYVRDGQYFFDGLISGLLTQMKIPLSIEIALDAEEMSILVRLNYGDGGDEAAYYTSFEIESFALLWNANPETIHGIDGDKIALFLKPGLTRYPFTASAGVVCELYLQDDRFYAVPHPDFADDLLKEAA